MKEIQPINTISQDLQQAIADLQLVNPWVGLWRFGCLGMLTVTAMVLTWSSSSVPIFCLGTAVSGVFYGFWLVCTHDMTHETLTGWSWFESTMSRAIAWPILWPYGVYAKLHHWHHAWNGLNLKDPERIQWTQSEYEQANILQKFYARYQWYIDTLILGGTGLIGKMFFRAWKSRHFVPNIRQQVLLDLGGMLLVQSLLIYWAISQGTLGRYLVFWLILERTIGAMMQARDRLEHYGLWQGIQEKFPSHRITQLYTCRNIRTFPIVGWLMGGLDYHAVHHAFPAIPFYRLAEAFQRIQSVLSKHELPPLKLAPGYLQSSFHIGAQFILIPAKAPK